MGGFSKPTRTFFTYRVLQLVVSLLLTVLHWYYNTTTTWCEAGLCHLIFWEKALVFERYMANLGAHTQNVQCTPPPLTLASVGSVQRWNSKPWLSGIRARLVVAMGVVCSSLSHMISGLARSPKIGCWSCGGYKTNYKDEVVKFLFPQVEPTAV